jgi:NAD(P)-dependent dehydrogenase (short-subunit alcohol dehydrogenase family)
MLAWRISGDPFGEYRVRTGACARKAEDRYIVQAWSYGTTIFESYRYAPGPASESIQHSHEEYQFCLSLDFPGEYRYRAPRGTDVPVNNAGVYPTEGVFQVSEETFRGLEINTVGPFRTCKAFVPGMVERGYGRVVNVSSGGGSFGEGLGPAAYAVSRATLNALTVKVSQAVRGDVKANAMCPGWVRTDMGGVGAPRPRRRPPTPSCGSPRSRRTARTAASSATANLSPGNG